MQIMMKFRNISLISLLSAVGLVQAASSVTPSMTKRDAHMGWWREAKFGMFIHWGLYAILARGEWVMFREDISIADYTKLAPQFNPVKFNSIYG